MHPELFTLPVLGISVKTYGFFMCVGFLSAVWMAMRRAQRVKADADCVLDLSFLALVFGVGGARLFYVAHYWKTDFADVPNTLLAVIDIRQGGLEFLGGFLGALLSIMIYLFIKKQSIRLYLDILAPSLMWGLAFGRLGCFFNGCCFGGLCVAPDRPDGQSVAQITLDRREAAYPWAVRFPFASPAHIDAWDKRRVTVPAELITPHPFGASLLPPTAFGLSVERRAKLQQEHDELQRRIDELRQAVAEAKKSKSQEVEESESGVAEAGLGPQRRTLEELQSELQAARTQRSSLRREHHLDELEWAQEFPSRKNPQRTTSESELQQLASQCRSPFVHPTQLYSASHAIILSGLLSAVFYQRKRHGVVIGLVFVLYPI
ncbi:MAG: prolipoprotein diacylglyceryl transferase, partial [Planctomycetota bacterium]